MSLSALSSFLPFLPLIGCKAVFEVQVLLNEEVISYIFISEGLTSCAPSTHTR